ncbi:MAG: hypothetical protein Q8M83_03415 [bacterium]|nr:hypothetical protein [bacterium]
MFLAIHATVGTLIGTHASNPIVAFFLSFISHFILDAIPHGDEKLEIDFQTNKNKKKITRFCLIVGGDVIVTTVATLLAVFLSDSTNIWSISCGIVGALLPDILQAAYLYSKHPWLKSFFDLHNALHYKEGRFSMPLRYGYLLQLSLLISIILIFK